MNKSFFEKWKNYINLWSGHHLETLEDFYKLSQYHQAVILGDIRTEIDAIEAEKAFDYFNESRIP